MSFAAEELRALGGYEIIRRLGAGGMAEVFLATQRMAGGVERTVVVKSILPHLADDDAFVKMFLREARIAAMLSHPNVVHIHDVAIIEGRACIVMEFLRGRDLHVILRRAQQEALGTPVAVAVAVAAQAAAGLDYAHEKTDERGRAMIVVHRDVSPHNLFVARDGRVRVLDFGIAKSAHEQQLTEGDALKGKVAYMAPEYVTDRLVSPHLDQFAIGVVLWEMLTGRRLFHRADPLATMRAVIEHVPAPPSLLAPHVPRELDEIVLRALARSPAARFPDCGVLSSVLGGWLRRTDARPDTEIVSSWLDAIVPSDEDAALYGPPTGFLSNVVTERDSALPSLGQTASGVETRSDGEVPREEPRDRTAPIASPTRESTASIADSRVVSPPRGAVERPSPGRGPVWLILGLAIAVASAGAWILARPEPPARIAPAPIVATLSPELPPRVTPSPAAATPTELRDPAPALGGTSPDAGGALIEVELTGDRWTLVTVDGVAVDGRVWRGEASPTPRAVFVRWPDGSHDRTERVLDHSSSLELRRATSSRSSRRPVHGLPPGIVR